MWLTPRGCRPSLSCHSFLLVSSSEEDQEKEDTKKKTTTTTTKLLPLGFLVGGGPGKRGHEEEDDDDDDEEEEEEEEERSTNASSHYTCLHGEPSSHPRTPGRSVLVGSDKGWQKLGTEGKRRKKGRKKDRDRQIDEKEKKEDRYTEGKGGKKKEKKMGEEETSPSLLNGQAKAAASCERRRGTPVDDDEEKNEEEEEERKGSSGKGSAAQTYVTVTNLSRLVDQGLDNDQEATPSTSADFFDLGRVPICRLPPHGGRVGRCAVATTGGTEMAVLPPEGMARRTVAHGVAWRGVARHTGDRVASPYGTPPPQYHGDLQIYYVHYAYASIYAFRGHVHWRKRGSPWLVLATVHRNLEGKWYRTCIPPPMLRVINYFAAVNRLDPHAWKQPPATLACLIIYQTITLARKQT
ncbi:hypothetical protein WH47_00546 [Habropoda laboriosa]|uniref:Uncharacterized protein n=1 Tax=Habropoda laboriosa TaxID=597456 RepID=A0A0L7R495_9HYME|nr:hypothetical protein WH47_00546 [Habropoda laboriosa]